jgi:hypothetical protein
MSVNYFNVAQAQNVQVTPVGNITATDVQGAINQLARLTGTVTPVNNVTPTVVGQEYLNTTTGIWYKSIDLNPANWKALY